MLPDYRTAYKLEKNVPEQVVQCPFFTTAVYDIDEPMTLDYSELDAFVILIGVKGQGTLTVDGQQTTLNMGETVLVPATVNEIKVEGSVRFLETFV